MSTGSSKVLVITQAFPPEMGGNASRMGDSVSYLADDGWETTVVAPQPCYPPGNFERSWARHTVEHHHGAEVHRLWTWQPATADPSFANRMAYYLLFAVHALLWTLVHGRRYDVYLCTTPPIFTSIPALAASVRFRKPLVVDVRDLWIDAAVGLGFLNREGVATRLSRGYRGFVFRTAARVLTTTDVMRERTAEDHPRVAPETLVVVPNGVDTETFSPRERQRDRTVVYIGNVGYMMDFEAAVRSMQYVESSLRMRFVGDGDRRPDVERLVDELGLGDRISFHDPVERDEVPDVLSEAMIGLVPLKPIPSLEYAVPIKVYEYMACKLPIVGTGSGAIETVVEEADTGVLVDNEPRTLAAALDALAADPERGARLGENGFQCATERYDRRVISERLSEILQSVVENSARP